MGVLARKRAEKKKVEKIGVWRENLTAHEENLISFLSLSCAWSCTERHTQQGSVSVQVGVWDPVALSLGEFSA